MNSNIYLSPHFSLSEFTASATARKYGIVNEAPDEAVENLEALCVHTLEPLRKALGRPIIITSGYRCKALNAILIHSSDRSQHMAGMAADFYVGHTLMSRLLGASRRELLIKAFRKIITDDAIAFDQVILYPKFIHVSFVSRDKNRNCITKANGQGTYCNLTRAQALSVV